MRHHMYFYPKLNKKKYPYSLKLISKAYNKKNINFYFKISACRVLEVVNIKEYPSERF